MAKLCTNCGKELADGAAFCTECGTPVPQDAVQETTPVAAMSAAAVGTAVESAPKQTVPPPPQPKQGSFRKPQPQAVTQPVFSGDGAPPAGSKYAPITTKGYIGIMLLMCVPVVGLLLMVIWACGGCKKINKRNLARATLIMTAIGLVIALILGVAAKFLLGGIKNKIEAETGISITDVREKAKDEGSGGLLGLFGGSAETSGSSKKSGGLKGLLGGLTGSGNSNVTNKDIEELEDLRESLDGVSGINQDALNETIDKAQDINREMEVKNSGWPKSLRAYPGGTATPVTSYRTEISGTTVEEMKAWIEDLKGDGFQYQDFYDFGMSESDMLGIDGWWATDGEIYLSLAFSNGTLTVDHTNELPDIGGLF